MARISLQQKWGCHASAEAPQARGTLSKEQYADRLWMPERLPLGDSQSSQKKIGARKILCMKEMTNGVFKKEMTDGVLTVRAAR